MDSAASGFRTSIGEANGFEHSRFLGFRFESVISAGRPSACCRRYTAEDSTRAATRRTKRMVPTVWLIAWSEGKFLKVPNITARWLPQMEALAQVLVTRTLGVYCIPVAEGPSKETGPCQIQ